MSIQTQYLPQTPLGDLVPQSLITFFKNFYILSDSPALHQEYANCFMEDGVMVLGSERTEGREGILALRHKMWELISRRSHHPVKIFPFGEINESAAEAEVMIYGTVEYRFKAGGGERKEWAARVEMVKGGEGDWKMRLYQVYLDTGAKK